MFDRYLYQPNASGENVLTLYLHLLCKGLTLHLFNFESSNIKNFLTSIDLDKQTDNQPTDARDNTWAENCTLMF